MVDGVNVNDYVILAETIKNDPALAEYTFRAKTSWVGGARARTKVQGFWGNGREDTSRSQPFTLEADQPMALLGTNKGPSPVECALSSLGACLASGIAYNAAARGIKVSSIEVELEGGVDIRGWLGIRESTQVRTGEKALRPGFENVTLVCRVKSNAPPSELKELVEYAKATSPVFDLFRNPVPIAIELEH
jgi:uncharacterized OsmC-like protein